MGSHRWTGMDLAMLAALSIFPLIGFFMLYLGFRNVWQAQQSKSWPVVEGQVIDSPAQGLAVRYQVGDRQFTTSTIHLGQTSPTTEGAEADIQLLRYPAGSNVPVFYNPRDPATSVLAPGFDSDQLWLLGGGLAFALPGIMFIVLFIGQGFSDSAFRVGMTLFGVIFSLIGLAMLIPGSIRVWHAQASPRWPSVEGTLLLKAEVAERDAAAPAVRNTVYTSGIVYEFIVNGQPHFAATQRFGLLDSQSESRSGKVRVFYNPSDPDTAVLEPGIYNEVYYLPGAGLAFLLFGLAVLVFAIPTLARDS